MCAVTFCNAIVSHRKIKQFPKHGHKGILTGGAKPELSQKQVRLRGNDITHALSSTAGPAGFDLLNDVGLLDERFRLGVLLCCQPAVAQLSPESGCPVRVDAAADLGNLGASAAPEPDQSFGASTWFPCLPS